MSGDRKRERVTGAVLEEVQRERQAQQEKWGEQNHEDGAGSEVHSGEMFTRWTFDPDQQKARTDRAARRGVVGWSDILAEEVAEAFAETDQAKLRAEVVQVAAVAVAWIEAIDRRLADD